MRHINYILGVTGIVLLLLNFYAIADLPVVVSKWIRIVSSVSFTVLYLFFTKRREKNLTLVFLLLVITDFLILDFEKAYMRLLFIVLMIFTYLSLIHSIFPFIQNLRTNVLQGLMILFLVPINIFLIFLVMALAGDKINGIFHAIFFFLYGIIIMLLIIAAFSFNFRYSTKSSFFFICGILAFVTCDIAGFMAYYINVQEFYYPDRLFYLLGLFCLVKYASLDRNEIIPGKSEIL